MKGAETVPKYLQISREIIASITSGALAAGDMAMSENDIITTYRVSNTTARRALQEVERAGWVRRIKGKGTVVEDKRVGRSVDRILGFTRNMVEAGRHPETKLLGVRTRQTGRTLDIGGHQYHMPGPVYVIERLRLADGIPIMEETRYISARLCPSISEHNLEASLYDLYEKSYGLLLTEVKQVLSTVILDQKALLDLFELHEATPAFLVEGVTFCGRDLILEIEESLYRGDQYQFTVSARRQDGYGN